MIDWQSICSVQISSICVLTIDWKEKKEERMKKCPGTEVLFRLQFRCKVANALLHTSWRENKVIRCSKKPWKWQWDVLRKGPERVLAETREIVERSWVRYLVSHCSDISEGKKVSAMKYSVAVRRSFVRYIDYGGDIITGQMVKEW